MGFAFPYKSGYPNTVSFRTLLGGGAEGHMRMPLGDYQILDADPSPTHSHRKDDGTVARDVIAKLAMARACFLSSLVGSSNSFPAQQHLRLQGRALVLVWFDLRRGPLNRQAVFMNSAQRGRRERPLLCAWRLPLNVTHCCVILCTSPSAPRMV